MHFSELGLDPLLLKAITNSGYDQPTDVQAEAIPAAITGCDLLVSAQTGSGKTAAFTLPSLQRLITPSTLPGQGPRMLVLTPTRELALQVHQAAETYGRELRKLRVVSLVGGAPYGPQLRNLSRPVDVIVATPGRLIDHLQQGRVNFDRLEILVLDEADRMLDMGFIDDIETIAASTPKSRQTLLFSATLEGVVGALANRLTRSPRRIEVTPPPMDHTRVEQQLLFADDLAHKGRLLSHVLRGVDLQQALVFTATKRAAEEVSDELRGLGFSADALHGDMRQSQRSRTLQRLRDGHMRVLVATDVAARGIDVAGISHVINFDLPRQVEDYVHRIGRTGRAGRTGVAVSLAAHHEKRLVRDIERFTGQSIRVNVIPGLEPSPRAASRPEVKPGGPRKSWGGGGGRPAGGGYAGAGARSGDSSWGNKEHRPADRPAGFGGARSSSGGAYRDRAPAGAGGGYEARARKRPGSFDRRGGN